ncbi:MAG: acireductone synthase, partial [Pseudomonadota bacterium]|nr:acireductone synthase [Pseudomonadota bacterium]
VLFLSDVEEELRAAEEAGLKTAWLVREGELPDTARVVARDFSEVDALLRKR